MNKRELLNLLNTIDEKISEYLWKYNTLMEQGSKISEYRENNRVTIPRKFYPTAEEKYSMSPKEIDAKSVEIKEAYDKAVKELSIKVDEFAKSIWYKDLYTDVVMEFDKLPSNFKDLLEETNSDYGVNKVNAMNSIIEFTKSIIQLKDE